MSSDIKDSTAMKKAEYFELREKRLKLVYKILYVIVAIWIASVICITNENLTKEIAPAYTFVLASSSLFIVKIISYALMEFRCMKVVGNIDEQLLNQAEDRYDNIWKSFSLILSFNGLFFLLQMSFPNILNIYFFSGVFAVCIIYFTVISFVELFKKKLRDKTVKIIDIIGLIVGILTSYSVCAIVSLVAIK